MLRNMKLKCFSVELSPGILLCSLSACACALYVFDLFNEKPENSDNSGDKNDTINTQQPKTWICIHMVF